MANSVTRSDSAMRFPPQGKGEECISSYGFPNTAVQLGIEECTTIIERGVREILQTDKTSPMLLSSLEYLIEIGSSYIENIFSQIPASFELGQLRAKFDQTHSRAFSLKTMRSPAETLGYIHEQLPENPELATEQIRKVWNENIENEDIHNCIYSPIIQLLQTKLDSDIGEALLIIGIEVVRVLNDTHLALQFIAASLIWMRESGNYSPMDRLTECFLSFSEIQVFDRKIRDCLNFIAEIFPDVQLTDCPNFTDVFENIAVRDTEIFTAYIQQDFQIEKKYALLHNYATSGGAITHKIAIQFEKSGMQEALLETIEGQLAPHMYFKFLLSFLSLEEASSRVPSLQTNDRIEMLLFHLEERENLSQNLDYEITKEFICAFTRAQERRLALIYASTEDRRWNTYVTNTWGYIVPSSDKDEFLEAFGDRMRVLVRKYPQKVVEMVGRLSLQPNLRKELIDLSQELAPLAAEVDIPASMSLFGLRTDWCEKFPPNELAKKEWEMAVASTESFPETAHNLFLHSTSCKQLTRSIDEWVKFIRHLPEALLEKPLLFVREQFYASPRDLLAIAEELPLLARKKIFEDLLARFEEPEIRVRTAFCYAGCLWEEEQIARKHTRV